MNLYSDEIRNYIRSRRWPKGLMIEVAQRELRGVPYLQFILFRNNFESFSGEDKWQIHWMVKEVMEKIRKDGVPIYLEVADDGA